MARRKATDLASWVETLLHLYGNESFLLMLRVRGAEIFGSRAAEALILTGIC